MIGWSLTGFTMKFTVTEVAASFVVAPSDRSKTMSQFPPASFEVFSAMVNTLDAISLANGTQVPSSSVQV